MKQNKYPTGWNERRVKKMLEHYESQTEDEAIAEGEDAFELKDQTVMIVPKKSCARDHPTYRTPASPREPRRKSIVLHPFAKLSKGRPQIAVTDL
jgi:hypothetical protein